MIWIQYTGQQLQYFIQILLTEQYHPTSDQTTEEYAFLSPNMVSKACDIIQCRYLYISAKNVFLLLV